ncbi:MULTISPECIES: glutathione S-transferase family protein [unclassified Pannonibacter]|uniref:glutathione S-transferase family protein n=1 Tax=unclassified Pannonibacter TaxID=2627228 RepID=UPI001648A2E1|nr:MULTISPECIES: glutathione S-transferase family protein [unclassified Pannonibacter]
MKIWGRINSTNVRKVLWCAEELGVAYDRIDAGGAFGLNQEPAFLAMNPNGLVPCIEDEGLVLWESNAIVRYMARTHGKAPFVPELGTPAGEKAFAAADKWLDWTSTTLTGPFRGIFLNIVRRKPEERVQAEIDQSLAACTDLLKVPDAALAKAPYLSGENLGIGDMALGCIAYAWFTMSFDRPDLPHLEAWYQRLTTRPAYQKAVMTPVT